MPRSNISDFDNESLTSDDEDAVGPSSPVADHVQDSSNQHALPDPLPPPSGLRESRGIAKFRAAGRAVIRMRAATLGAGAEPGVDVKGGLASMLYGHLHDHCQIEVIDYNDQRATVKVLENQAFKRWITGKEFERKSWAKVRWINVVGLSWEVIRELGIKYSLHPLALEDLLNDRKLARSKADYYTKHLFLRIVCHELGSDAETSRVLPEAKRTLSPTRMSIKGDDNASISLSRAKRRFSRKQVKSIDDEEAAPARPTPVSRASSITLNEESRKLVAERVALRELKKADRIDVVLRNMCIFLTRDNTVISFCRSDQFSAPISLRLRQPGTSLRVNPDPSMLVHALLDLIVDRSLEVMDAYHERIQRLEKITLLKPKMSTVRALHIISGDLILHKRTMEPLKHLVYGLRRYDLDRCIALAQDSTPDIDKSTVKGYMSHKSKVYLADVVDHVEHILSSMDMFAAIAENLINYTFNLNSTQMNEIMRRLTIITVICLPLTLLTGYFGMNFDRFWSVHANSDLFFWKLAIPIIIVVVSITLWSDFERVVHYGLKRIYERKVQANYRKYV